MTACSPSAPMVTRCTSRPSDRSRRRPLSRTKRPRRTRDGGARRSRRAPPSRLREAAFSGPVRRRRRPTARRNAPPVSAGARTAEAPAGADESTCTPGSVAARRYRRGGGDHSSWPAVAGGLARPTRRLGRAALGRLLRGLAPGGVCRAAAVARGAGGLLPHRFTLTGRGRRSVLCGTVPRVTPGGR